MAGGAIRAQIKLEGGTAFANDFKNAASAIKSANAELGYFTTELKKNGNSQDALQGKTKALQNAFDAEQNVIDSLTNRIEELSNMTGQDTTRAVDELTAELYKHKTAQAQLGAQVEDTTQDFAGFGNEVGVSFALVSKAIDLAVDFGKKVWDIGKGAVEYNAQMESYSKTIEAFFKTSGQTAEEASKNTADLLANQKDLSAQIGIGADKLIDANKMLIASGVNGEKSQKAISALAKAIVATGGGNEELSRMSSNLMQIVAVGKASAQDMKQFSMAGVDVYGLMAETTGKTVEQLKDMDITFDMIVEALDAATSEGGKFFEASQVGASTLQGQMNLLDSTIKDSLGTAFEPVNTALREQLIPAAISLIEDIDWNKIGEGISFAVGVVTEFVNAVDEFRAWYDSVYGEPAQETINAFTASQEDLNEAFLRTGGNIQVFDKDMAGAVEAVKGHGNHMVMEFDGMEQSVVSSVQETAGEVKNILIDQGWEMMQQGETNAYMLGEGIANGSISAESETKAMMDTIMEEVNKRSEAEQYGADFVSGFATGMHRNNGLLANAAKKLAEIVKEYLHFSRPDVGPLRDYENWMPDFVSGLADSMRSSEWIMADAARDLAQTVTNNTTNNISMNVYGAAGQDPNQIANVVMLRIQEATNRRSATWA